MKLLTLSLSFFLLLFVSCSKDSGSTADNDLQIQNYIISKGLTATKTNSGMYYAATNLGAARKAKVGDVVHFTFKQYLLSGTVVGESYANFPEVTILESNHIDGFKEAMSLLGAGGTGTFIIPSNLAFGANAQGLIPANSPLGMDLTVLGVYDDIASYNKDLITKYIAAQKLNAKEGTEGIYYVIDVPGTDPKPTATSTVSVKYKGYFMNGQSFDDSKGTEVSFGLAGVIRGWTLGMQQFGTGGKGKLIIPSNLAYGATGNSSIPPNYPLIFDVELVSFK